MFRVALVLVGHLGLAVLAPAGCLGRDSANAGRMHEAALVLAGHLGLGSASMRVGGECTHTYTRMHWPSLQESLAQ